MRLSRKFNLNASADAPAEERRSLSRSDDENRPSFDTEEQAHDSTAGSSKSKLSRVISMGKSKISKSPMNLMHNVPAILRKPKDSGPVAVDISPQEIQRVIALIDDFKLIQSQGDERMVIAMSGYSPLTDPGVAFSWFRMNPLDNRFLPIEGVTSYYYHPCADDIGCRICVQCMDAFDQGYSRYAETECIVAPSKLKSAVERHLAHNHVELPWTIYAQSRQDGVIPLGVHVELKNCALTLTAASGDAGTLLEIDITGDFQAYAHAATNNHLHIAAPLKHVTILSDDPSFMITYNQNNAHNEEAVNSEAEPEQQLHLLLYIASSTHRDVVVLCLKGYAAARREGVKILTSCLPWANIADEKFQEEGVTHGVQGNSNSDSVNLLLETEPEAAIAPTTKGTPVSGMTEEVLQRDAVDNSELLEELRDLRQTIDMYKAKLLEQEEKLAAHSNVAQQLYDERDALCESNDQLQQQNSDMKSKIDILQSQADVFSQEKATVDDAFAAVQTDYDQLKEKMNGIEQQQANGTAQVRSLQEEILQLKEAKASADTAVAGLQADLHATQEQNENHVAKMTSLEEEIQNLQTLLSEANSTCEQLREETNRVVADAEEKSNQLQQTESELQQVTERAEQLDQDVSSLTASNEAMTASLQTSYSDTETHVQRIQQLEEEKAELVGSGDLLQRVRGLNAELDKTVGEKNHWMKKAESLTKDVQKMLKQSNRSPAAPAAPAASAPRDQDASLRARIEELEHQCNAYKEAMQKVMEEAATTTPTPTSRSSFWG